MADLVTLTLQDIPRSVAEAIVDDFYGAVMWQATANGSIAYPDSKAVATIKRAQDEQS